MIRIITIAILITLIIIIVALYFFPIIKRIFKHRHFRYYMGKKIYKIAHDNDYLLLQNLVLKVNADSYAKFDHILFGNNYFYLINDKSYSGDVIGSNRDEIWQYYSTATTAQGIKNPLRVNQRRMELFSNITGIDKELLINIVVYNDDSLCTCVGLRSDSVFICKSSELKKLIAKLESRNVPPFDEYELEKVVNQVSKLNQL